MSPEAAKVFLAEDNADWIEYQRLAVTRAGHQIVVEVDDVDEGLAMVNRAQEQGANVALLDGRIPNGAADGTNLARALRRVIPEIKIVDISIDGDAVENADASMPKDKFNIEKLGQLITNL